MKEEKTVIVPDTMSADEANVKYGERYGIDWAYLHNAKEPSKKEISEWKLKAEKWDALESKISDCYGKEVDGEFVEHEDDSEESGDLIVIGEIAAIAFGFL